MRQSIPAAAIIASLLTLLQTATGYAQSMTSLQQRGSVLARGLCSRCHAVGTAGENPHPAAPRFRVLDNQTSLDKLAQRMREGLLTGHEAMPMFRFSREDADAMVAYIRSVQRP